MTQIYNSNTNTFEDLEKSPLYVLSNDTFMSGWGSCKGKINVCVVPCENGFQAEKVMEYIKTRSEQKRARIVINKPKNQSNRIYSLVPNWLNLALKMI